MSLDTPSATSVLLQPLLDCGPLKVWSVAVTLLGDACTSPRDQIRTRDIDRMLAPLGITNQALRVALHRLKRDGWVEAEKHGRSASYRLSAQGWASTEAVRARIYNFERPDQPVWMSHAPPDLSGAEMEDALPEDALRLSPRTALIAGQADGLEDWVHTPLSGPVPDWLRDTLVPEDLQVEYTALATACPDLAAVQALLSADQSVLRLLILHHWRRLRLRHGDLPDLLLGEDWAGAVAANKVPPLLTALPRADLADRNAA